MNKRICLLFLLLLVSCSDGGSFSRVSYETMFNMATCGNMWNGDIYNPSAGPEGFVDYRGFFQNGYAIAMKRDFSFTLSYQIKNADPVEISGTYFSQTVNSGSIVLWCKGSSVELSWATYYQLRLDWNIISPVDGQEIHTIALLQSGSIFTV